MPARRLRTGPTGAFELCASPAVAVLRRHEPRGERKVLMPTDRIVYLHSFEFTVWERDEARPTEP